MWGYAFAICAIVVSAEAAGLGGASAGAATIESVAFVLLLLASIALALRGNFRR
jgi:uncharacterized membrane protein YtjA (UPF0391 family)